MPASMPRIAAALVALVCWAGLAIQFAATYGVQREIAATLWILLRFFTVITNLTVAVTITRIALGGAVPPSLLGGVIIAILLVGVVYMTLLRGLLELSGGALLADALLHRVSPVLAAFWWLVFAPHGRLRWRAAWWWALYPLAYFAYAIVRGRIDGRYPYPFIDVATIGLAQTLLNAIAIAVAFIVAGYGLVWLDRLLGRRRDPSSAPQ